MGKKFQQKSKQVDKINNRGLKLAAVIYRLTEKFPENEILKMKLRTKALEICEFTRESEIISNSFIKRLDCQIKTIKALLFIALRQNWLAKTSFEILVREYDKFFESVRNSASDKIARRGTSDGLPKIIFRKFQAAALQERLRIKKQRQNQILKSIAKKDFVSFKTLRGFMPLISDRTLRYDVKELVQAGRLVQKRKKREVLYQRN